MVWGWFGVGSAVGACDRVVAFLNGSAWFGVGNRRRHESDDNSTVRRTCPQTIYHEDIA